LYIKDEEVCFLMQNLTFLFTFSLSTSASATLVNKKINQYKTKLIKVHL